jgi:myo-inositol-1(or 4)-monophosphatase
VKELDIALKAAEAGAKVIRKYYEKKFKVRLKGKINLVTEVDEKAQAAICKIIHSYFPNDAILAEEGDFSRTKAAQRRWIIDPIDGTTNFAHGYPVFCVSVAFEKNGEILCGVINDPTRRDIFHAVKGKGAFLNRKRIHVSKTKKLEQSLLITGFPYDLDNPLYNNIPYFLHFIRHSQAVRRDGSAALNMAYVAAGRFDGFWELSLCLWDYAAGLLLVKEAGGLVKHISGRDLKLGEQAVIASNPTMYPEFQKHLKRIYAKN